MRLSGLHGVIRASTLVAAVLIAGCSSGSKFGGPSWNLTGSKGGALLPPEPLRQQPPQATGLPPPERQLPLYRGGRDPVSGRAPGWGAPAAGFDQRPLAPMPNQPSQNQLPASAPHPSQAPVYRPPASPQAAFPRATLPGSTAVQRTIEVKPGQSLTMIASEQRVSIAALMQANRLTDPYVIPGQSLIIPAR